MTMVQAINWYHLGLSCLPCYPNSKRLLKGIRINQQVNFSDLVRWFGRGQNNIALRTGFSQQMESYLTVLDFDDLPSWFIWKKGIETYTVETKRGYHCYFWVDEPVMGQANNCEIKQGQPVMIPPSKVDGHQYYVVEDYPIMRIDRIDEVLEVHNERKEGIVQIVNITINGDSNNVILPSFFVVDILNKVKASLPITLYLSDFQPVINNDKFGMALCPGHSDSNRSLGFNHQLNLAKCFNPKCPLSGSWRDVIGIHSILNNYDMGQAVADLATKLGL